MDTYEEEQLTKIILGMEEEDEEVFEILEEEPDNIPDEIYQQELERREVEQEGDVDNNEPDEEIKLPYELDTPTDKLDKSLVKTITGMAEILQRKNYYITDGFTGELYVFIDHGKLGGTYIEATESIEYAIKMVAEFHNEKESWARLNKRKEVYHWINKGLRKLENPDIRHLNVSNGLIYIAPDGYLIDFINDWSSDNLTTTKLPVAFDHNAKCPAWEKFVAGIFPPDSQHIAWEVAALLMIPLKNKAASAIILKGEKNTGKTTFQNGIISFIGHENVSNLSLDRFGERFQDTQLKGKLANIVGEMPNTKLSMRAVNTIKKLIGNDYLSGEIKGGATFKFLSYARCLFSCNEMPTCDSDDAFFDRFIIIPFTKQFSKNPVYEKELNEALSSPEELSGLLNKALQALPNVIEHGIRPTQSMKAALEIVIEENDALAGWFKEYIECEPYGSSFMLFTELHDHYKKCEPQDRARQSNIAFGRALKKLLPEGIFKKQINAEDGSKPYGFKGMRFKESVMEDDYTDALKEFDLETLNEEKET